eukprot:scaffold51397_cov23-Tisochrysis_lutea.AAC.4
MSGLALPPPPLCRTSQETTSDPLRGGEGRGGAWLFGGQSLEVWAERDRPVRQPHHARGHRAEHGPADEGAKAERRGGEREGVQPGGGGRPQGPTSYAPDEEEEWSSASKGRQEREQRCVLSGLRFPFINIFNTKFCLEGASRRAEATQRGTYLEEQDRGGEIEGKGTRYLVSPRLDFFSPTASPRSAGRAHAAARLGE